MKKEKISTNFLISTLAILIASFIAILDYTTQTLNMDLDYNVYSFFHYVTKSTTAAVAILVYSVFWIGIGAVQDFINEIQSGYFKRIITSLDFKKYINRSFVKMYTKAFILIPGIFGILTFTLGAMHYGLGFIEPASNVSALSFPKVTNISPLAFCMLGIISNYMLCITIVNVLLITHKHIKNNILNMIIVFISFIIISFIANNIFNVETIVFFVSNDEKVLYTSLITYIVCALVTAVAARKVYSSKEKLVLEND